MENYDNYMMNSMLMVMNGVNRAVNEVAVEEPADEDTEDVGDGEKVDREKLEAE